MCFARWGRSSRAHWGEGFDWTNWADWGYWFSRPARKQWGYRASWLPRLYGANRFVIYLYICVDSIKNCYTFYFNLLCFILKLYTSISDWILLHPCCDIYQHIKSIHWKLASVKICADIKQNYIVVNLRNVKINFDHYDFVIWFCCYVVTTRKYVFWHSYISTWSISLNAIFLLKIPKHHIVYSIKCCMSE